MFNLGYHWCFSFRTCIDPVIVLIIRFYGDFNFVLTIVRRIEKFLNPIYANGLES